MRVVIKIRTFGVTFSNIVHKFSVIYYVLIQFGRKNENGMKIDKGWGKIQKLVDTIKIVFLH